MPGEVSSGLQVSGVNPFSQNQVTQGRTYGNTAELQSTIRQLFGEMPHNKTVDAYENVTATNHQLPYYFVGQSAYLQEKIMGLTNRAGGWMTDVVLPWARTDQITFTWDEYHFEHTLVGRVPHQGVPRVVKTNTKSRSASSKRHGIGFVMEAGELLTQKGIQQYSNNIRGIVACILETVYLNSIYALLDACEERVKEHMAVGVSQTSIMDDFDHELEDFAGIARHPQAAVETIDRKHRLLDMIGAQRVFLITTPESGVYMSQLRSFQKPDPGYLAMGPDAQMSKPTEWYDFVIQTSNGPISVFTARDLKSGEKGNFIKPLYAEPWIAEFFTASGRYVQNWPIWNGFEDASNCIKYGTHLRDVLIYSCQKDRDVRISFKKMSKYSAYANEDFLQAVLKNGPGNTERWAEKHFYPSEHMDKMGTDTYQLHRPDEDNFHRWAPSLLYWDRTSSEAKVASHFGMMDSTALSTSTIRATAASLSARGNWNEGTLPLFNGGILGLLEQLENARGNDDFFQRVYDLNVKFGKTRNSRADQDVLTGGDETPPGVLTLPEVETEGVNFVPAGFAGYAGLQSLAAVGEGAGYGDLPILAARAISLIRQLVNLIDGCLDCEDTKEENRPINYLPGGMDGKMAAFVNNLIYTDRSPLFLEGRNIGPINTSSSISSGEVASAMVGDGKDLSTKNFPKSRSGLTVVSSLPGINNPIVSNTQGSTLWTVVANGSEARALSVIQSDAARSAFLDTMNYMRITRDELLSQGQLSPDEAIISSMLSNYSDGVALSGSSDKVYSHVAGIAAYISKYQSDAATQKDAYLNSLNLIQDTVRLLSGQTKKISPTAGSIRKEGKAFINSFSGGSDNPYSVNSKTFVTRTKLANAMNNIHMSDNTAYMIGQDIINFSTEALNYSRAKWHDGNNTDALLLKNPGSSQYDVAINSENVDTLYYSDHLEDQDLNIVSAVFNYAGNDANLLSYQKEIRDAFESKQSRSREISSLLDMSSSAVSSIGDDMAMVEGEYVMTSMYATRGVMNSGSLKCARAGNYETGYIVGVVPIEKMNLRDKANQLWVPNAPNTVNVKTYEHSLKHCANYLKSSRNVSSSKASKFDRFGGSSRGSRFGSSGISSKMDSSRRGLFSSALQSTSASSYSPIAAGMDEFNLGGGNMGANDNLSYDIRRRDIMPVKPRQDFQYPDDYRGPRGAAGSGDRVVPTEDLKALNTSNYREHMVEVSNFSNPIVKVLAMAFLSSKCLRKGGKDPFKRLEDCNVFTPIGFINFRSQIQHAMETWIMGEPGYGLGANIYAHNQFIVGVDATTMMIYGNLAYYHKSLVYDNKKLVLLPYIRPRKYICGSEDKFVTSEKQMEYMGLRRPDIISLGVSSEEPEFGSAVPILGWYKYPDMNRMLESNVGGPAYSGYMEFRSRFRTQASRIMTAYAQGSARSYKDMLRKIPPVAFQGRQITFTPVAGASGQFDNITRCTGHRSGGCVPGSKLVWDGKRGYFNTVNMEGLYVQS